MTDHFQQAQLSAEPVSFQLNWGSLAGLRWGNPNGTVILALHGWLDNAHSFLPLAEQFLTSSESQHCQLIALDWAGHGHSDHRPAGNYYPFLDYVYDVVQLAERQQWQSFHVIGHSMGGYAANLLAGVRPDLLLSLTIIEAFGLLTSPAEKILEDLRQSFKSRSLQQQKRRPHYPDLATAVQARLQAGDFSELLAALLVHRGIEQLAENDFRFRADGQLRTKSPLRMSTDQVSAILQAIACPMQLILGSSGHRKQLEQGLAQWQTCVPQLQIAEVTGGHHVHMEQPEAIWRHVRDLLATAKR
ncbi:alpha/beta fold hydrolase [Pseudidiomarina salilacus]|uniref:alpha/beta fold hydrolase n=1 Tax=Pseudidiomarina salilacus TaxID=3384452 RepID=UPI00398564A0